MELTAKGQKTHTIEEQYEYFISNFNSLFPESK